MPQAAARGGDSDPAEVTTRRCRREPGGVLGRLWVRCAVAPSSGGCQAQFQLLLPLTSSAFRFHMIDYYLVKVFGLSSVIILSFVFLFKLVVIVSIMCPVCLHIHWIQPTVDQKYWETNSRKFPKNKPAQCR